MESPKEVKRKSLITQPFLNNMTKLGMLVSCFDHTEDMIHLGFEFDFSLLTFIDWTKELIPSYEVDENCVTFSEEHVPAVKRLITKEAKNIEMPEDWEEHQLRMECNNLLGKLGALKIGCLGEGMEFEEQCCDQSLPATVSPENRGRMSLMLSLIMDLIPRELGGVSLKFNNCSSELYLGFQEPKN